MQQNKEMEDGAASETGSLLNESDDESYCPTMSVHSSDSESVSLVASEEESEVEDGIRVDDVDAITNHFDASERPVWDDQCDNFDNYLAKLYRIGAHLKGSYGRVLLSAFALDGNNEMFPVAWAIVSCEDEKIWKFFIWHLKHVLEPSKRGDN